MFQKELASLMQSHHILEKEWFRNDCFSHSSQSRANTAPLSSFQP